VAFIQLFNSHPRVTDDHPYERFFIGIQPKPKKQKQKQMVHYASTPYGLLQFVQSRLQR
jgi:hypothetical protein